MQKSIFDTKKDFNQLKYNVFGVTGDLTKVMPEIAHLVSFIADRPDRNKLIRYGMALYDRKSPLIKQCTDIGLRKREAAIVAGYDLDGDGHVVQPLFDMLDDDLQQLVIEFLKDQNNFYWSMIVSNEQTFYELQKALLAEVVAASKDKLQSLQIKGKLMDECDKIAERIEAYYIKVFGDEDVIKVVKTKKFTPESMANR